MIEGLLFFLRDGWKSSEKHIVFLGILSNKLIRAVLIGSL